MEGRLGKDERNEERERRRNKDKGARKGKDGEGRVVEMREGERDEGCEIEMREGDGFDFLLVKILVYLVSKQTQAA